MTDCRWNGSHNPRVLTGRHDADCPGEECRGCQPCTEPHCAMCQRAHVEGRTCAECLATAREALRDIARMCASLPAEVEHRGVDGEAMMLLGPAADPEARGHLEASVLAGRVPPDYLETANHELHPLFVLGTWDAIWRDALEHDEAGRLTVATAVDYLDRQMTYMADHVHVPFEDFAGEVRACQTHLKSVLNDRDMGDRANVGCFDCGGTLERRLTKHGFEDHWTCHRCRRKYTYAEYNFALRAALEDRQKVEEPA